MLICSTASSAILDNIHEAELPFGPRDPSAVHAWRASYSTCSGAAGERHKELCPTRPGASWGRRILRAHEDALARSLRGRGSPAGLARPPRPGPHRHSARPGGAGPPELDLRGRRGRAVPRHRHARRARAGRHAGDVRAGPREDACQRGEDAADARGWARRQEPGPEAAGLPASRRDREGGRHYVPRSRDRRVRARPHRAHGPESGRLRRLLGREHEGAGGRAARREAHAVAGVEHREGGLLPREPAERRDRGRSSDPRLRRAVRAQGRRAVPRAVERPGSGCPLVSRDGRHGRARDHHVPDRHPRYPREPGRLRVRRPALGRPRGLPGDQPRRPRPLLLPARLPRLRASQRLPRQPAAVRRQDRWA